LFLLVKMELNREDAGVVAGVRVGRALVRLAEAGLEGELPARLMPTCVCVCVVMCV
jgi:hypothetical protein